MRGEEREALAALGDVSEGVRLQAMAVAGDQTVPVELKAIDRGYPLYGSLTLKDGRSVGEPPSGQAWLSQDAADRLALKTGMPFTIGTRTLKVGGIIQTEPDRLGEGFQLGPTVIVDAALPEQAGLLAPGSMFQSKTRVAFDTPRDPQDVRDALEDRFPEAGFDFRTADRASPGADRFAT